MKNKNRKRISNGYQNKNWFNLIIINVCSWEMFACFHKGQITAVWAKVYFQYFRSFGLSVIFVGFEDSSISGLTNLVKMVWSDSSINQTWLPEEIASFRRTAVLFSEQRSCHLTRILVLKKKGLSSLTRVFKVTDIAAKYPIRTKQWAGKQAGKMQWESKDWSS